MYELNTILESMHLKTKNSWEQTRFISYILAQVNSSKTIKQTDILKFSWDKEEETTEDETVTNEDKERLKKQANEIINELNKK